MQVPCGRFSWPCLVSQTCAQHPASHRRLLTPARVQPTGIERRQPNQTPSVCRSASPANKWTVHECGCWQPHPRANRAETCWHGATHECRNMPGTSGDRHTSVTRASPRADPHELTQCSGRKERRHNLVTIPLGSARRVSDSRTHTTVRHVDSTFGPRKGVSGLLERGVSEDQSETPPVTAVPSKPVCCSPTMDRFSSRIHRLL